MTTFDYADFPASVREPLMRAAAAIRRRSADVASGLCQLGKLLKEARDMIGNQIRWGAFCRDALEMDPRRARRYIDLFEAFGESPPDSMVPTAMERLARPFVPDVAREEAVKRAARGEKITTVKAREILQKHDVRPTPGSNRGYARPLTLIAEETLYKLRGAIRQAYRDCEPAHRDELRAKIHALADDLHQEAANGDQPRTRGPKKPAYVPSPDEIAKRAASIRGQWSDDEERQRRA